jgi:hypothetical protein
MGVLYYLALVLGLFGVCWALVGEHTARWLFMMVHGVCATAVLLLYMKETLIRRVAETRRTDPAAVSRTRRS